MTELLEAFPSSAVALLSGSGREFIKRIGQEAAREAVAGILKGENVRTQTEFLTRARITQLNAALVAQFVSLHDGADDFSERFFDAARDAIAKKNRTHPAYITAQWFLGLTNKSVQNVLRGSSDNLEQYVARLDEVLAESALKVEQSLGEYAFTIWREGAEVTFDWTDFVRLSTAIGAQTLSVRGSDKSMYGKLFERLVLGSALTLLGFTLVPRGEKKSVTRAGAFWLSDSADTRECDATAVVAPGKIVRFDIGFIGPGNSEISKDKLSRFTAEINQQGKKTYSKTIIVVDRLPRTNKTLDAAAALNADIVQMSMKFWPIELAQKLQMQGWSSTLAGISEARVSDWIDRKMDSMNLLPFIGDLSVNAAEEADSDE
ncbi:CfrBI family restriction endonuclease [Cognatilysobacter terrigena]|uniref:CfrBI family restriction endonuclease n=1 Tax=Cognatilysobacter terrigena TaxID=2488749 RepID=UPI00105C6501|nr:CfrBI family restriction endonuclease [Lysobacter terrigena]